MGGRRTRIPGPSLTQSVGCALSVGGRADRTEFRGSADVVVVVGYRQHDFVRSGLREFELRLLTGLHHSVERPRPGHDGVVIGTQVLKRDLLFHPTRRRIGEIGNRWLVGKVDNVEEVDHWLAHNDKSGVVEVTRILGEL